MPSYSTHWMGLKTTPSSVTPGVCSFPAIDWSVERSCLSSSFFNVRMSMSRVKNVSTGAWEKKLFTFHMFLDASLKTLLQVRQLSSTQPAASGESRAVKRPTTPGFFGRWASCGSVPAPERGRRMPNRFNRQVEDWMGRSRPPFPLKHPRCSPTPPPLQESGPTPPASGFRQVWTGARDRILLLPTIPAGSVSSGWATCWDPV